MGFRIEGLYAHSTPSLASSQVTTPLSVACSVVRVGNCAWTEVQYHKKSKGNIKLGGGGGGGGGVTHQT